MVSRYESGSLPGSSQGRATSTSTVHRTATAVSIHAIGIEMAAVATPMRPPATAPRDQ